MEVAHGVHLLTQGVVNWYLVEDGDKVLLVDAGAPADWEYFVVTMGRLGHRLLDVDAVVITHAHSDHTGFAERARTTTDATVWIHEAEAEVARGIAPPSMGSKVRYMRWLEYYRTLFSLRRRGGNRIVPIRELSTFTDGEILDVPGRPRVIHTPGHTDGSAVLHLESRSALITGDSLVTRDPLTGRTGPRILASPLNRDTPMTLESLGLLTGVTADVLLPGHGDPWRGGIAAAVREARRAGPS